MGSGHQVEFPVGNTSLPSFFTHSFLCVVSRYQLYNADVWAVVVVVTLVAAGLASWLSYRILRALLACCCRPRKTKKD